MYYDEEEIRKKAERIQRLIDRAMETNNLDIAIKKLDEALEIAEEDGVSSVVSIIWGMKGATFFDYGAPPVLAIKCLKNAIMADPSNESNYDLLARIYIEIDEPEIAMRYMNQARMLSRGY
ncbi:tetratricopeptide repeat protein [Methanobrevibacter sp.]|uniref:tetratricopeptide repeat protein n=1 Tax=Methanobrevibacter sp. TaxID=66852 RepID=UPI00386C1B1C